MRRALLCALTLGCGTPAAPAPTPPPALAAPIAAAAPPVAPTLPPVDDGVRRVTLSAAGDLVPNGLAMRSIRRAPTEDEGYRTFLAGFAASIREEAVTYVNLEVPLVDDVVALDGGWPRSLTSRPRRAPVLGATPALATVLHAIGVDVVGLANNHAFDQDHAGLRRTRDAAVEAGLTTVGASEHREDALGPVVVERSGLRIAFVSFTTGLNRHASDEPRMYVGLEADDERVTAALARARTEADVVVVLVHWSNDFVMEVRGEERVIARRLVDAGADVIFGTGPHVLHEVARLPSPRGEALVAYSLGNVASGMGRGYRIGHPPETFIHPANVRPEARDGLVLHVGVASAADGTISIEGIEGDALWTENDYLHERMEATVRVARLAETADDTCIERLAAIRAAIGDLVTLDTTCPTAALDGVATP